MKKIVIIQESVKQDALDMDEMEYLTCHMK